MCSGEAGLRRREWGRGGIHGYRGAADLFLIVVIFHLGSVVTEAMH